MMQFQQGPGPCHAVMASDGLGMGRSPLGSPEPSSTFEVLAPGFQRASWSEAQALGAAVWLWMHSASHRTLPLHTLNALLMPALKRGHFMLVFDTAGRPVFYMAWADLSAQAERRYIDQSPLCMPDADWASGDRTWVLDWIAPFGHSRPMCRLVRHGCFATRCFRSLDHRGQTRGLRMKQFHGAALTASQAQAWFAAHPLVSGPTACSAS